MDLAGFNGVVPSEFTEGKCEPGFGVELNNVRRGAASVRQTFDALDRAERWNSHLHSISWPQKRKFFEQVSNGCRLLAFIARAKAFDG